MSWTPDQMPDLTGRTAVVTGANSGIGEAIVTACAAAGANVVIDWVTHPETVDPETRVAEDAGSGGVTAVQADVSKVADLENLIHRAVEKFGRLDVMINNAGILNRAGRIHNLDDDEWRRVIDVNLMGTLHGMRAAIGVMKGQKDGGSIINTASAAGLTAWPYASAYCATKAAIIQLTKVAAVEYARERSIVQIEGRLDLANLRDPHRQS